MTKILVDLVEEAISEKKYALKMKKLYAPPASKEDVKVEAQQETPPLSPADKFNARLKYRLKKRMKSFKKHNLHKSPLSILDVKIPADVKESGLSSKIENVYEKYLMQKLGLAKQAQSKASSLSNFEQELLSQIVKKHNRKKAKESRRQSAFKLQAKDTVKKKVRFEEVSEKVLVFGPQDSEILTF